MRFLVRIGLFTITMAMYAMGYNYIFLPGMGGSVLYNHEQQKIWPPRLFMDFNQLHMKFDPMSQQPIIPPVKNVGNLEDVRIDNKVTYFFTKNTYYSKMIQHLETQHSVYAFPYDFRYIMMPDYYLSLYKQFNQFIAEKEDIVFVCHSMGGLLLHDFLNHYLHPFYFRKIRKVYYINVPFGGVPYSFYALYESLFQQKEVLFPSTQHIIPYLTSKIKHLHHFGGLYLCLPVEKEPIFRKEGIWYNSYQLQDFFATDSLSLANYRRFQKHHAIIRRKSVPLDQVVVYSTNLSTFSFFDYDSQTILSSTGDGLVPTTSLLYPYCWKHQPTYVELYEQEHSRVNNYQPLIEMVSHGTSNLIY